MLSVEVEKRQGGFTLRAAFTAPEVGVTALFGRSGAGKSTLVNILAGLLRPDRGRIALGERVLYDSARRIDLPPERRRIGYVFQDARLFPHLAVEANLRYGFRRARDRGIAFDQIVALLALAPLLGRRPATLSGGEKQRVALGRALLAQPLLLLLDEPLASLDQHRKDEILPFLERLRDELALPMIYVSHAMPEVLRLADTLVLLDQGRVAASGPVGELLARPDLEALTGHYEAGALLTATVAGEDAAYGLTRLDLAGETLWLPSLGQPPGAKIRLRVRARDVSLALRRIEGLSIQNQLAARVIGLRRDGHGVDVSLEVGGQALWARITARAADSLGLAEGQAVLALIKAVTVERAAVAR